MPEAIPSRAGELLADRYRLLKPIGEGGMGIVYEALHVALEKRVAIKILRDDFSRRPEVVQRFRQEAKSASRVGDDHIVDISDFGETPQGLTYFVMEMLDGEDLGNVLSREGRLDAERAAYVIHQCCEGLGAAHRKGIIHRDIKPENIILVEKNGAPDFVKLVDFGIAKIFEAEAAVDRGARLTKTGVIFGTPEYMAPEQAAGKPFDHRVDIYALGVIFYELLTGKVPFEGETFMAILSKHMFEEPTPVGKVTQSAQVPAPIERVVAKAMAKDPNGRYQTMEEFAQAIEQALVEMGAATLPSSARTAAQASFADRTLEGALRRAVRVKPRKRPWLYVAAAVVAVAAAVGVLQYRSSVARLSGPETKAPSPVSNTASRPVAAGATPNVAPVAPSAPTTAPPAFAVTAPTSAAAPGETPPSTASNPSDVTRSSSKAALVSVMVHSRPEHAEVSVPGRGVLCPATPCRIDAREGETMELRAERAGKLGHTRVTIREGMKVTIKLSKAARRRKGDDGDARTTVSPAPPASDPELSAMHERSSQPPPPRRPAHGSPSVQVPAILRY